jgi:hypothetical protein
LFTLIGRTPQAGLAFQEADYADVPTRRRFSGLRRGSAARGTSIGVAP